MKTVEIYPDAHLPVILNKITHTGIKRQVVVLVKIFIPDIGILDITNIKIGCSCSFLKLRKAAYAEGKKNSKESKFLLHVGGFA